MSLQYRIAIDTESIDLPDRPPRKVEVVRGEEDDRLEEVDMPDVGANRRSRPRPLPTKGTVKAWSFNRLWLLLLVPILVVAFVLVRRMPLRPGSRTAMPAAVSGTSTPEATESALGAASPDGAATARPALVSRPSATSERSTKPGNQPNATSTRAAARPVTNVAANLRAGPGTNFRILGLAPLGQALAVTGRNNAGDWLQLASGAWINASLVDNAPAVPVSLSLPTPAPPTPPRPN
jgi:hypothetical protein